MKDPSKMKETAQESREKFCKSHIQKVVNVQNIRGAHTTQYTLRRKKVKKDSFPKKEHKWSKERSRK